MNKLVALFSISMYVLLFALYLDDLQSGRVKWKELPLITSKVKITLNITLMSSNWADVATEVKRSLDEIHSRHTVVVPHVEVADGGASGQHGGDSLRVTLVSPGGDLAESNYYVGRGGTDYFVVGASGETAGRLVSSIRKRVKRAVEGRELCPDFGWELRFVIAVSTRGRDLEEVPRKVEEQITKLMRDNILAGLFGVSHVTEVKYNISMEGSVWDIMEDVARSLVGQGSPRRTINFVLAIDPPDSLLGANMVSPDFGAICFTADVESAFELFGNNLVHLSGMDPFDVLPMQRLRLAECLLQKIGGNYEAIGSSALLIDGAVSAAHMRTLRGGADLVNGMDYLSPADLTSLARVYEFSEFVMGDYDSFEFANKQFEIRSGGGPFRYLLMIPLFSTPLSLIWALLFN